MRRVAVTLIVIAAIAGAGLAGAVVTRDGSQSPTVYYGCVHKHGGELRIVDSTDLCRPGERPISWNQSGPQGVPGQQGPPGPSTPTVFATLRMTDAGVTASGVGLYAETGIPNSGWGSNPNAWNITFARDLTNCAVTVSWSRTTPVSWVRATYPGHTSLDTVIVILTEPIISDPAYEVDVTATCPASS
jgi:hypothetical protein